VREWQLGACAQQRGDDMSLTAVLPLAFVMIAGPQIVSAFFLATSRNWAKNSASYLAGAALAVTTVVTLAYQVARGATGAAGAGQQGTAARVINWILLGLILFLIVRVYLTRNTREPPKWMGKLQRARPGFAFMLGRRCWASSQPTSSAPSRSACTSPATGALGGSASRSWR
jgi:hypothetical protein